MSQLLSQSFSPASSPESFLVTRLPLLLRLPKQALLFREYLPSSTGYLQSTPYPMTAISWMLWRVLLSSNKSNSSIHHDQTRPFSRTLVYPFHPGRQNNCCRGTVWLRKDNPLLADRALLSHVTGRYYVGWAPDQRLKYSVVTITDWVCTSG